MFMPPWRMATHGPLRARRYSGSQSRFGGVAPPFEAFNPSDPSTLSKESGLTAEALAEQTAMLVLLEAVRAVDTRQRAVVHGRAQQGAHGFIRRL